MRHVLDFEKSIAELEARLEELRHVTGDLGVVEEVGRLQSRIDRQLRQTYGKLTACQKVQVARHPERPHCSDYVAALIEDWTPLAGDRLYGDDSAIMGGLGRFRGRSVVVIGHEKGSSTETRVKHNFGMAHPEGYRKALSKMELAAKFKLPIICLIDTGGAYPGIGAEERGQAYTIAYNLRQMSQLATPIACVVIGEGGSGGALGIGIGDHIAMLQYAYYSVISPEGCAGILWKNSKFADQAARALKFTSKDLLEFGVIDEIIPEPLGAAHRDHRQAANFLKASLTRAIRQLSAIPTDQLLERRYDKFRKIGVFEESAGEGVST